jgi:Abortive infection C-terminus
MPQALLTRDVSAALARFFTGGPGPTHSELDEIFAATGMTAVDPKRTDPNATKEVRVRAVLSEAMHADSATGMELVELLLARMRVRGSFDPSSDHFPVDGQAVIASAQRAFRNAGWMLDDDGHLAPEILTDLDHHLQRQAIEASIDRIRRSPNDAALLIGTAKELLETISRYVLEEVGQPARDGADFGELLHLARERLGLLPQSVSQGDPAARTVREVYDGLWKVAKAVNELRNVEGTGHGRTRLPTVSSETARAIVQAAALLGALLLDTLDSHYGPGR